MLARCSGSAMQTVCCLQVKEATKKEKMTNSQDASRHYCDTTLFSVCGFVPYSTLRVSSSQITPSNGGVSISIDFSEISAIIYL